MRPKKLLQWYYNTLQMYHDQLQGEITDEFGTDIMAVIALIDKSSKGIFEMPFNDKVIELFYKYEIVWEEMDTRMQGLG